MLLPCPSLAACTCELIIYILFFLSCQVPLAELRPHNSAQSACARDASVLHFLALPHLNTHQRTPPQSAKLAASRYATFARTGEFPQHEEEQHSSSHHLTAPTHAAATSAATPPACQHQQPRQHSHSLDCTSFLSTESVLSDSAEEHGCSCAPHVLNHLSPSPRTPYTLGANTHAASDSLDPAAAFAAAHPANLAAACNAGSCSDLACLTHRCNSTSLLPSAPPSPHAAAPPSHAPALPTLASKAPKAPKAGAQTKKGSAGAKKSDARAAASAQGAAAAAAAAMGGAAPPTGDAAATRAAAAPGQGYVVPMVSVLDCATAAASVEPVVVEGSAPSAAPARTLTPSHTATTTAMVAATATPAAGGGAAAGAARGAVVAPLVKRSHKKGGSKAARVAGGLKGFLSFFQTINRNVEVSLLSGWLLALIPDLYYAVITPQICDIQSTWRGIGPAL